MTLDEMYQETAKYIDETLIKVNGQYTGDSLKLINSLKSAINYAYKKICREKYRLEYFETISKDSPLTKTFYRIKSITVSGTDIPVEYEIKGDNLYYDYDGQIDILYDYIPDELVNLTDVPLLPESTIDHKILCFYAAFHYLNIEGDDNAAKWLNLWNDGFTNIIQPTISVKITNVYGGW